MLFLLSLLLMLFILLLMLLPLLLLPLLLLSWGCWEVWSLVLAGSIVCSGIFFLWGLLDDRFDFALLLSPYFSLPVIILPLISRLCVVSYWQ